MNKSVSRCVYSFQNVMNTVSSFPFAAVMASSSQQQQVSAPVMLTPQQAEFLTRRVEPLSQKYAQIKYDISVLQKEQKVVAKELQDTLKALQKTHVRNIAADVQVVELDSANNRAHVVRKRKGFSMTQVVTQKKVTFNRDYVVEVLKEYCMLRQIPLDVMDLASYLWEAKNRTIAKTTEAFKLKEDNSCVLQPSQIMDLQPHP